jgi:hypothetical protein
MHLGDPEVEQLDLEIRALQVAADEEDVARLDVSVDDAVLVGDLEGLDDLDGDREHAAPGERAGLLTQAIAEGVAREVLHDKKKQAVGGEAVVGDVDEQAGGEGGPPRGLLVKSGGGTPPWRRSGG